VQERLEQVTEELRKLEGARDLLRELERRLKGRDGAEQLAAEVVRYHRLSTPVVWVEHHPPETNDGSTETFDLVAFSSYEVREREPYMGEVRLTLGEATWERITRSMVAILVGGEV
jgi:hypothetical protein